MTRTILLALCCIPLCAQTPRDLHATAATSRQVQLAWTAVPGAAGYIVERKPLGGQYPTVIPAPITEAAWNDSTIDAFGTYVYRVRIAPAGKQASNEITVGPPPVGFSTAVPVPKDLTDSTAQGRFGLYPQLVLDSNGDPSMSYFFQKGEDDADSTLHFVSWDRATYKWKAPVEVTKVGHVATSNPLMPFSMARDASTNAYGVVFPAQMDHALSLAVSTDGGATWQVKPVIPPGELTIQNPSLALWNGVAHLVWIQDQNPHQYAAGKETDDPASWKKTSLPTIGEAPLSGGSISLAIDEAGNPGIAYLIAPYTGYNTTVAFWRPGGQPVKVTDSHDFQNDAANLRLAFFRTKPRIVMEMGRTEARFTKNEWIFLSASSDDGKTWPEPAYIPNDMSAAMGRPFLAIGPKDEGAVMMERTGGGGDDKCGIPKLARSNDLQHWTTCSANKTGAPKLYSGNSAQLKFASNGKLYAVIANQTQNSDFGPAPTGLVLWREP